MIELSEEERKSGDDGAWDAEELDRLREESVVLLDRYGKDT